MLVVIIAIFAILIISTSSAGARLEGRVLADIERGTYEETPGTAKIVQRLRAQGVIRDDDGRPTVDAAARSARVAAAKAQVVRTAIIVISAAGLLAVATKLLLDRSGN
jgi:hypothetical protein